jgi:hypothetical protein
MGRTENLKTHSAQEPQMKANPALLSAQFKAAHKMARRVRQSGDDYRAVFGACLAYIRRAGLYAKIAPKIITVSRNTYEYRQILKDAGFKWNPISKSWTGDANEIVLDFQRAEILALAESAPAQKSVAGSMATRNGPGRFDLDNLYL